MIKHIVDSKSSYHALSSTKEFLRLCNSGPEVSFLTMKTVHQRIKFLREEKKMSKGELARRCGVKRSAVSQWELNGPKATTPDGENLLKCAEALGTTSEWLLYEKGSQNKNLPTENRPIFGIIEWKSLDQYLKACLNPDYINIKQSGIPFKEFPFMWPLDLKFDKRCFALVVHGDAMTPEKMDGDTIIIDPTQKDPLSKTTVLFKNNAADHYDIRQFIQEGDAYFLRALNKDKEEYPKIPIDKNIEICGTVLYTIKKG